MLRLLNMLMVASTIQDFHQNSALLHGFIIVGNNPKESPFRIEKQMIKEDNLHLSLELDAGHF